MSTPHPKVTYAMAASRRQGAAETTSGAMSADQLREFLLRQQQQQQQLLEHRLQQEVQQQDLLQHKLQLKQEERLQQEQCRLQELQEQQRLHHLQQERFQEQQRHHQQIQDQLHCQHLQQVEEELKRLHQQHQTNHVILQKLLQLFHHQQHPHDRSSQLPEELSQLHDQQQQIAQLLVQWQHRQKEPLNQQLQDFLHQLQLRIQFQQQRAQQLLLQWQQVVRQHLQQPQRQEPPLQMSTTSCPSQLTSSQTSYMVSLPQREPPELMTTQPQMQQLPTLSTPISSLLDQLASRTTPATTPSSVPSTAAVTTTPATATAVASATPHGAVPLPRSSATNMRPVPRSQLQHHPQLQAPSALQSHPLQQFRQSQPLTPSAWCLPSGMTPYPNPNKQPHHLADSPAMQPHQLPQSCRAVCQGMPPPPLQTTRNEKHQDKGVLSHREPRGSSQRMFVGGNRNAHIDRQHTGDPRRFRHFDANRSENPTTPLSSPPPRREPDAKLLEKFRRQYAEQEEEDVVAEHLRQQSRTKNGTIGTLCINVCLDIIDCHEVTFVVTDTGTGKSTLIPKALAERDPRAMVVNCQPRRTSAISLAQRVAVLMGDEPGETVGFSVRGEHVGELGKTRVMYVTNYTLFLHLMSHDPSQIPFTHIILDEFHERNSEVEVMLLLLKMALQRYPNQFKVVLCSASGQVEQWRSFFNEMTIGVYNQANSMFDIHEYYLEDICKMLGMYCGPRAIKKNNTVDSLQLQGVLLIIKKMLEFLAGVAAPQHSILVFLPGRTNVEHMCEWIRSNFNEQLDPIAWYRDVDLSFIQDAIMREAITKKKVYLATDIAEVSVTIPDVVFVIDSGTSKRPLISERDPHSTAFPPLQLLWENAMNAQQRRGRVGRVQQGFYFSMISEAQKDILAHGDPRISNEVITELVLHTLQLTASPFAVMGLCHYQPRLVSVTHSLVTLRDGGFVLPETDAHAASECVRRSELNEETLARQAWDQMITEEMAKKSRRQETSAPEAGLVDTRLPTPKGPSHPTLPTEASLDGAPVTDPLSLKYVITVKGLVAAHLPVSVEASSTVFYGLLYGIPNLAIIAAAVEATRSPFNVPYHVTDLLERATLRSSVAAVMGKFKGNLKSDLIASVGAVLAYMDMQRDGLSDEGQEEWCSTLFLSRTRLIDVTNLVVQMRSQTLALVPFPDVDDVDILLSQFDKYAPLLNFIVVATHTQWGFYINHDEANATRNSYDGIGIFFQMRCARDMFVASVCPWAQHSVCVPLSLQIAYNKLRGTVATQVSPAIFNLALLIFSYRVWFERLQDDPKVYQLQACYMNVFQTFHCDEVTAKQIIQIRRMQCARLHTLQLLAEGRVGPNDTCETAASLRAIASDFGLPDVAYEQPHLIAAILEQSLAQLLHRLQDSSEVREVFCRVVQHCPPSDKSSLSLLIHSNNGIVAPAAIFGANSAQAAAQEAARVERLKTAAVVEHRLNSSSSDSETGHIPQFTFDD